MSQVARRTELLEAMKDLGRASPLGYLVNLHIRNGRPGFMYSTLPEPWRHRYAMMSYALRDPVVAWGLANSGVAHWGSRSFHDACGFFEDARRHGIHHGFGMATGNEVDRSIIMAGRADRPFQEDECVIAFSALKRLHSAFEIGSTLDEPQLEALRLVARGDRYDRAAEILGISSSGFKARLKSARDRLGARTTIEAVEKARHFGLL